MSRVVRSNKTTDTDALSASFRPPTGRRSTSLAAAILLICVQAALSHEPKQKHFRPAPSVERRLTEGFAAYEAGDFARTFERLVPFERTGPPRAQFLLAMMYLNGLTPLSDKNAVSDKEVFKGKTLLEAASKGGETDATFVLGYHQVYGNLLPKNERRGLEYLKMAAALKHFDAMYELGWLYLDPGRLPLVQDRSLAFRLFYEIADRYDDAAYPLALCYLNGYGTSASPFEAYTWSLVSAKRRDNSLVREVLEKAVSLLDPIDRQRANDVATQRIQKLLEHSKKQP